MTGCQWLGPGFWVCEGPMPRIRPYKKGKDMPFLDSPTIRPLYDVQEGGPPFAFRCMLCNLVTKKMGDMRQHQQKKHHITYQEEIHFEEITPTTTS